MEDLICKKKFGILYKILCFFETQIDLYNNKRKWLNTILLNLIVVLFNSLGVSIVIYLLLFLIMKLIANFPNSAVDESSYFEIFPNLLTIIAVTNLAIYIQNLYSNKYNSARNMKKRIFAFIGKINENTFIKSVVYSGIYFVVFIFTYTQTFKLLDKVWIVNTKLDKLAKVFLPIFYRCQIA